MREHGNAGCSVQRGSRLSRHDALLQELDFRLLRGPRGRLLGASARSQSHASLEETVRRSRKISRRPRLHGVDDVADGGVLLRVDAGTNKYEQWQAGGPDDLVSRSASTPGRALDAMQPNVSSRVPVGIAGCVCSILGALLHLADRQLGLVVECARQGREGRCARRWGGRRRRRGR